MEVKGFNFVKDALEEQEKVNVSTCVNPNDNPDDKKNKKRRDSGDSSSKTHPKRKKLSTLWFISCNIRDISLVWLSYSCWRQWVEQLMQ